MYHLTKRHSQLNLNQLKLDIKPNDSSKRLQQKSFVDLVFSCFENRELFRRCVFSFPFEFLSSFVLIDIRTFFLLALLMDVWGDSGGGLGEEVKANRLRFDR
jgi:hypothetical protein